MEYQDKTNVTGDEEPQYLEIPIFVSRGNRPYAGIVPSSDKPKRSKKGLLFVVLLSALLILSFLFWL